MGTLIEIKDLAKTYERGKQKVEVLHHVNLDIAEGDFLALPSAEMNYEFG